MSEIDYSQRPLTYRDIESYTQGVEIRDLSRRRAVSNLPIIYSGAGDLSVVNQDFGIVAFEDAYTPFSDKRGRVLPQEVLDLGAKTFDETQSYHTDDLSTTNGLIEPLSIRETLTSTNANFPAVRGIKGDVDLLSINSKGSSVQTDTYEFAPESAPGNAFFDAQDQFDTLPIPGFSGIQQAQSSPFDDQGLMVVKSVYYTGRYSREAGEFGTKKKALGRGFTYDNCKYGTDSIAFGGLTR